MGSSRTHTLSLVLLVFGILGFGFGVGFLATDLLLAKRNKNPYLRFSAGGVMAKRMSAIKEAVKRGTNEYEFQVSGFRPILK